MILKLNELGVDCIIGERPDERLCPQHLRVDVALTIRETASETDRLEDTVDYAALSDRIRQALSKAQCRMIERAARIVVDTCLEDAKVSRAQAVVTKCGTVACLGSASAICELENAR